MARRQFHPFVLLLMLLVHVWPDFAYSSSTVKFLPGFQGPLPFHLETGYVGVGESEDVQLFYYFVKSERNPKEDPLLLWLTGGPTCSALSGLVFEIGPLNYEVRQYNGTLPTMVLNPFSWTKAASIIFLDLPVGTGFSYARNPKAFDPGDFNQINQAHQFLRKWLISHPEFIRNPLYISGDSYSGLIVPPLSQEIFSGNDQGALPLLNFQGYILGNPATISATDGNFKIPFAHGMGLISDELYESLTRHCKGQYKDVDPRNLMCLRDVEAYNKCTSKLNPAHILEAKCTLVSPKRGISLYSGLKLILDPNPEPPLPTLGCRSYTYLLSYYWANDRKVRKALHIQEGSIGEWERCHRKRPYKHEIFSSFEYHANLSFKGYPSLIYSGDHDMLIPFLGTQAWIRSLNYSIVEDWRPWFVGGQISGYTRSYSNKMTFATVKGGGHTAPEYRPKECLAMFQRWVSGVPL